MQDETTDDVVRKLSKLSDIDYDHVRKQEARNLGIRVATLDREVKKELRRQGIASQRTFAFVLFVIVMTAIVLIFAIG